jgi:hypothetical protein
MTKYNKLIVAVIGAALTWAIGNYAGNDVVQHWLSLATALATAAGVFQVKNAGVVAEDDLLDGGH